MAIYKIVDTEQLDADMTIVANAIRNRGGMTERLEWPIGYKSAVENIPYSDGSVVVPVYEGTYEITPSAETQTLPTADKRMSKDVKVKSIPYSEETNSSGGTIIYIACSNVPSDEDNTTAELGEAVIGEMKLA